MAVAEAFLVVVGGGHDGDLGVFAGSSGVEVASAAAEEVGEDGFDHG